MRISIAYKKLWRALVLIRFLPFYNKERRIIGLFKEFSKDLSHPGAYKWSGIPKQEFLQFLFRQPIEAAITLGSNIPNKFKWLSSDKEVYLSHAIYDNYINEEHGNLKITSLGERYIKKGYYVKKIFMGPFTEKVLFPFVSIPILALLTFYLLSFLGFRIDDATLYGISVERRPEIDYLFDEKIDGFKISWKPDVNFEQIDWLLKIGEREYFIKTYSSKDPFVIYAEDVTRILAGYSLDLITKNIKSFSKDGHYSESELQDGIECEILPRLSKQGMPIAAKIRYQNKGSSETHETLDLVLLKGLGGSAPRVSIERNVSKESWDNFLDEGGILIKEILLLLTEKRQKYKNDTGECFERYILEYRANSSSD